MVRAQTPCAARVHRGADATHIGNRRGPHTERGVCNVAGLESLFLEVGRALIARRKRRGPRGASSYESSSLPAELDVPAGEDDSRPAKAGNYGCC